MVLKLVSGTAHVSLALTGIASAQTTATTTPGIPNTGAGDVVISAMILAVSAVIAVGGALYLYCNRERALG